ncbi:MAG TPA: glycosyltransferase [Vitreimonas sp.]|nr:glycosyltransferase [Vitreimonas sp.]
MKVLFFPTEVGLAHVTRSLAVAEAINFQGHEAIMAVPAFKHRLISNSPVELVDIPAYTEKNDAQVVEAFLDVPLLKRMIQAEMALIEKVQPDVVVVDFRLSALIAAAALKKRLFVITGSGGLPEGCYLPNPGLPQPLHVLTTSMLKKIIWKLKQPYLNSIQAAADELQLAVNLNELFLKVTYIIPEIPSYLPAERKDLALNYVGSLSWQGFNTPLPPELKDLRRTGQTIYISFGGTGFDPRKLILLSNTLAKKGYQVVVSSSNIAQPTDFEHLPNLFVFPYLPGDEVARRMDAVVCHGGYGTMMQAIENLTPAIAIPFNPDQVLHSFRFQELGMVKSCLSFKWSLFRTLITGDWAGFQNLGEQIDVEQVITTVEKVLHSREQYVEAAKRFKAMFLPEASSTLAARVILGER